MHKDLTLNIHKGFKSEFNQLLYNFPGKAGDMNFFPSFFILLGKRYVMPESYILTLK